MASPTPERDTMNVVIVGHVDHGKSTLVGRLLADTGVLGDGKLEKVQETCKQQGKDFEYAFLLDALEEEQGQGITIDAARVFFRTQLRDYIIIDAPGHIEFLKNMVTGAARAEAAVLLIDAKEGVQENSRRHGYLLSMLGIKQVVVAVNKIDLVDYSEAVFRRIEKEYRAFLAEIGIEPQAFIPISARAGDGVAQTTEKIAWHGGSSVLGALDAFKKSVADDGLPLRFPIQDVYKFNERGDDRRILAGRIASGTLCVGDKVQFSPSGKVSTIATVEAFNAEATDAVASGLSTGVTVTEQLYVTRGEVLSHVARAPHVSTRFRANLFWLGRRPMRPGQRYRLKIGTKESEVTIDKIHRVLDASDLTADATKEEIERHDVADVSLKTRQPIAFDLKGELEATSRFVLVDEYDIAGGGIVREALPDQLSKQRLDKQLRELEWVRGDVPPSRRAQRNGHPAQLVMLSGDLGVGKHAIARAVEHQLFDEGARAYMLDGKNVYLGVDADIAFDDIDELVRRFGEVAHILLDTGLVVISTTNMIGLANYDVIATQVAPVHTFVVHLGPAAEGLPEGADLRLDPGSPPTAAAHTICEHLRRIWARTQ